MARLIPFLIWLLLSVTVHADNAIYTPAELAQWKDWVLEKHPDRHCPRLAATVKTATKATKKNAKKNATNNRHCVWPGTLAISITADGARFQQTWEVYAEQWLSLPGSQQHWPTDISMNGKAVTALEKNKLPVLKVTPGVYKISGKFHWQQRPQFLLLAKQTALTRITIDGENIAWPTIDATGRLWFTRPETADKEDSVKAEVFRRVQEGIPMTMETELRLVVSGKPRELQLGRALLADSEITRFHADLPARIEADGSLRIQVRAGSWVVSLASRFTGKQQALGMQQTTANWPAQEIWSFASSPNIRGVKISGVKALDPSQLDMPEQWRSLPTYLIETSSTLILEEQYRGDAAPAANQIKARRQMWLDFDGKGATISDTLTGVMNQGWRLSVQPAMQLGRVSVNGQAELVTRMDETGSDGVEIRHKNLQLDALSRVDDNSALTASGWQHDLQSLSMELNLPPGWQLWHASGADRIQHSWLSRWDLWDVFLCLLITAATFRLLSLSYAGLAAVTLALTYHESYAPLFSWLVLIIVLPLLQVLPHNRLRKLISGIGYLTLLGLVVISLLFAVQQLRRGLYPQLERPYTINTPSSSDRDNAAATDATATKAAKTAAQRPASFADVAVSQTLKADAQIRQNKSARSRYQASANTQTGPGQPTWNWNRVNLSWSGPVTADAPLRLYLSAPWLTRLLMFLQVGLLAFLVIGFGRQFLQLSKSKPDSSPPDSPDSSPPVPPDSSPPAPPVAKQAAALMLALLSAVFSTLPEQARAEDYPPRYLLEELATRLTAQPDCAPHCSGIDAVQISVHDKRLSIRMRVATDTPLAVALPYDATWQARRILVDGEPSDTLLKADKHLWLPLTKGQHDITIEAQISGAMIKLPFRQSPHNVSVNAPDWEVSGLVDKRIPSRSLQLHKREKTQTQDVLLADPIQPFVKVQRQIDLDIDWYIATTVTRFAPEQGGVSVNIPLLPGETVISEGIDVIEANGQRFITATLAAQQDDFSWLSVMQATSQINLTAIASSAFVETWSVQASTRWHIDHQGLTPIKRSQHANPVWLPWPGESVVVKVVKPEPVPGPTTTVESASLISTVGERSTDLQLRLQIRTSSGGDFRITPPANAKLERLTIAGQETTLQQQDNSVILPLRPGIQDASINWSIATGTGLLTRTPAISLSRPASNINVKMQLARSRWPLWVNGPDMGPAMLYWGLLLVILFVAVGLGRVSKQQNLAVPLNTWQWILLALGMSTVNMLGSIPVVLWFFAMEARARVALPTTRWKFNLLQTALVGLTVIAVKSLFAAIPESLLSTPNMQVTGNGSHNYLYQWYQDNSSARLPQGYVISVPVWIYRIAMLAWSLWLVFALLGWAKWSWQCFSKEKLWATKPVKTE